MDFYPTIKVRLNGKPLPDGAKLEWMYSVFDRALEISITLPKEEHETIITPIVTLSDAVRHWAQGDA